jgi:ABC-type dipeptide/oligopeptide/nickel transport system permease subunit
MVQRRARIHAVGMHPLRAKLPDTVPVVVEIVIVVFVAQFLVVIQLIAGIQLLGSGRRRPARVRHDDLLRL